MEKGTNKKTSTKKETVVKDVISNDEKNEINNNTIVETQELENAKEIETAVVEVNTKEEEDKKRRGLILLILLFLCVFTVGITYGNGIFNSIKENILETNIITKPKITEGSKEWKKEEIIKILKDSKSKNKIEYYEYCIIDKEDSDKCEWTRTDTKNVRVSNNGHHYVYIRAVDEKGKKGKIASTEVYIDNEGPSVEEVKAIEVTKTSIKVKVEAKDKESGIDKYLYSLDGENYKEGSKEYLFSNLESGKEYKVYVRIVDKLGNSKIVTLMVKTEGEEETTTEEIKDENGNVIVPDKNNETGKEEGNNEEDNWDIPEIDLELVPTSFEYGSEYELPSHYDFGNDTGSVVCKVEDKEYTNTKDLLPGKYTIKCVATSSHNKTAEVEKEIEVLPQQGEDEILEGWIKLNLYYPENATDWQWRLDGENNIRTGYNGEGWQDYTGPILVKIEDVPNIFIRYKLKGETYIIAPKGKPVVDIDPDYYELTQGNETKVRITYESGATVKEYRINGEKWLNYPEDIEEEDKILRVGPGTLIEARVEKEIGVYDNHGNQVSTKKVTAYDSVYISLYEQPGTTKGDKVEKIEGPIISSNPDTGIVEDTMVSISTQYPAKKIYYKEGYYGRYKEYTGPVKIEHNTTIYAYYVRMTDSKQSKTSSYSVSNIKAKDLPYIRISTSPRGYIDINTPQVTVSISGSDYDGDLEYSYDGITYQAYTGPLTVTEAKTIYAKGRNQYGETIESTTIRVVSQSKPQQPSYYLEGPTISSNPSSGLVESTTVSISTQYPARKIYYKEGIYGKYVEYTGPITVRQNGEIYAYYVRDIDGKTSDTSVYYVSNIKRKNLPYVKISTNPGDYLDNTVNQVIVSLSGSDYTGDLEYSYDEKTWNVYEGPITITTSKTIYAKAKNQYGETVAKRTIRTLTPGIAFQELEVLINVDPQDDSQGLVGRVKVEINYDARATKKYYKLNEDGEIKEYTGAFNIEENATIYAWCTNSNGYGEGQQQVDYLTTGISSPAIIADTTNPAPQYKVEIYYDRNADVKCWWLDGESECSHQYEGAFWVSEDTVVYAYNKDAIGNEARSQRRIKYVVTGPQYAVVEKDGYYILKANYPDVADTNSREYKWKENGTWKKYDPQGILLIKPGVNFPDWANGIEVEDEKGNKIVFTDHYYFLDQDLSEVSENLFIRWDNEKPAKPVIGLDTEDSTREVEVTISYSSTSIVKKYKTVTADGIDSGWKEYTGPFKVRGNNTTIIAKGINRLEIESNLASKKITNIDEEAPTISILGNYSSSDAPKQKVGVTVKAKDDVALDIIKYAKGRQTEEYFENNGTVVGNNTQVTINANGYYTFYAVDKVGNAVVEVIKVENIDLTAPILNIIDKTEAFGIESTIEIDYEDSDTKQYSIGNNTNYKNYTGEFTINSEDVYELANEDGSLTIYAKGKDSAGNITETSQKIYTLDLDMPDLPVITANIGYPTITEYGVEYDDILYVNYAKRNDIINYIDTGDGQGWRVYTGVEHVSSGTVKAKSVKKTTGLETPVITKQINTPSGIITPTAYDNDEETYFTVLYGRTLNELRYIAVSDEMIGKKIILKTSGGTDLYLRSYNAGGTSIKQDIYANKTDIIYTIPENTTKISLHTSGNTTKLYEIGPYNTPIITETKYYPEIGQYGTKEGYSELTVEYFSSSVSKLYKIDDGQWQRYDGTITLEVGHTLTVKGIDKYAVSTPEKEHEITYKEKSLTKNAYDNDMETYFTVLYGKTENELRHMLVSSELVGRKLIMKTDSIGTLIVRAYNESGAIISSTEFYGQTTTSYIVPANTVRISLHTAGDQKKLYEIIASSEPTISVEPTYPKITRTGIIKGKNEVTINYYDNPTKKYKIDNGQWQTYNNSFEVGVGKTVYAKGISSSNEETDVASYLSVMPSSILDYKAYDSNINTVESIAANGTKSIDIANDGIDKFINLNTNAASGSKIKLYNNSGTLIREEDIDTGSKDIEIPASATKLELVAGSTALDVSEISLLAVLQEKTGDSILSILSDDTLTSGYYNFIVNNSNYRVHLYVLDGNQTITTNTQYGTILDCATGTTEDKMAKNMVIVKVKGNYTVNEGVTVEPFHTQYGGPKGFALYVTGKLTNKGEINNNHGAYVDGEDVYLWKNSNGTYEYIPAEGAAGGTGVKNASGTNGENGTNRSTGGGGAGGANWQGTGGAGGVGTSYSGGSGGGAGDCATGLDGSLIGGAGGNGKGFATTSHPSGGGAGNPGGTYNGPNANDGGNGTGGLLIIYSNSYENTGTIAASGTQGGTATDANGGSSGGGSINIFTNQATNVTQLGTNVDNLYNSIKGITDASGGEQVGTAHIGGAGGNGTINIGEVRNGTYYDLKTIIQQDIDEYVDQVTITGNSILSILNNNNLSSGYYQFKVTGKLSNGTIKEEVYPVHLYVYNENTTFTEDMTFGDESDISMDIAATTSSEAYRSYASNMVIVKVNGNLTINQNVTVEPFHTNNGGPKGFLLFVTGTLTNNGEINNNHGAYALGQDVFLWKNVNGTYEYVPAEGAIGGTGVKYSHGTDGENATGRSTGGGGAGGGNWQGTGGVGGVGTSYSGGAGGGAGDCNTGEIGSSIGGAGGNGKGYATTSHPSGGGAGNPGGIHNGPNANDGGNGTGGLLIIYSYNHVNSGTITASGTQGGTAGDANGGSSGGGSINIFYKNNMSNTGTIEALGGATVGTSYKGGAGGTGSVTIEPISGQLSASPQTIDNTPQLDTNLFKSEVVGEMTRQALLHGPIIKLDTTEETETKNITIESIDNNKIEYSIDLGETWIEYTDQIVLKENTIILTRTKDEEGNIVSTSTMTVTSIKKEDKPLEEEEPLPEENPTINDPVASETEEVKEGDTNE